ncbi:hypothetical protein [Alicyclobacillus sp. SO9]|uniref:hypothetical protein n=1 Tax=Alicyclobacillus sp. SO9 TaxID=2665646 RepID=UPI0018E8FE2A|nr:hypothetical protein [Alicyclobacillus sp. SO9]QQE79505.1 hypothetical protein GI364_03140 [Alicyclobacillus sp. SO9]
MSIKCKRPTSGELVSQHQKASVPIVYRGVTLRIKHRFFSGTYQQRYHCGSDPPFGDGPIFDAFVLTSVLVEVME